MSNKKFDLFKRLEELPSRVYLILGIVFLTVHVLLCTFVKSISVSVCGLVLIIIYVVVAVIINLIVHKRISFFRNASDASEEQNNGVIYTFRHLLKIPYAVVTDKGKIVTVNSAMRSAAGPGATVFNADITEICNISMDAVVSHLSDKDVEDEFIDHGFNTAIGNLYAANFPRFRAGRRSPIPSVSAETVRPGRPTPTRALVC